MNTLAIHPEDKTTEFLAEIYSDKSWTVIVDSNISKKALKEAIKSHERIIMLGHGTKYGLLGYRRLVIDSSWVYLLREKTCVCIWCNADQFVNKYGFNGFYTGMIISEIEEAQEYGIPITEEELVHSNKLFAEAVRQSIDSEDIVQNIKNIYVGSSPVINFNRSRIYFNG